MKKSLGFTKNIPDEFAVVTHAPLAVPPQYELVPPTPGAARPQETAPQQTASIALFGSNMGETQLKGGTTGETALLQSASAKGFNPDIRAIIQAETAALNETSFLDASPLEVEGPEIVAAEAERTRIQAAKADDQPITGADAEVTQEKSKIWDWLF